MGFVVHGIRNDNLADMWKELKIDSIECPNQLILMSCDDSKLLKLLELNSAFESILKLERLNTEKKPTGKH